MVDLTSLRASGAFGGKKKTMAVTDEVWKQAVANLKMKQLLFNSGVIQSDTEDINDLSDEEFLLIEQEIENMTTGIASVG